MINITHTPGTPKQHRPDRHYGETVELTIRKSGYSITELARVANCNRRTIYNWFTQKQLSIQIIYRIGQVLRHDFSKEFPELFSSEDFNQVQNYQAPSISSASNESEDHLWKDRYITLLERYNETLCIMQSIKEKRMTA